MLNHLLKYSGILFLLWLGGALYSQNEASKWYFGNSAGLDFMANPPTILTNGVMGAFEGCSSIADAAGNFLFCTNGLLAVNQVNQVMANSAGLGGSTSSAQSALIIKQPGNTNIYYIFTTLDHSSAQHKLCYSIVNMNLAAGNGSVIAKSVTLALNSSEKLASVRHCNGTDIWLISHDRLSSTFRAHLLSASGINTTAVTSIASPADLGSGCLKAAPSGRKLGMTNYGDPSFTAPAGPFSFAVYDFDNATGIVSNAVDLGIYPFAYGCEFSPDETKFYGTDLSSLHQWDLCAGAGTAIAGSHQNIYTIADTVSLLASLQRAPNGKIYAARYYKQGLGVINNPNLPGVSCNYLDTAQSTAPRVCQGGLPNFMPLFKPSLPSFTTTVNAAISCNTATFNATALTSCPFSGYVSSMAWDFGDPASGPANASSSANPVHTYTNPGVYDAKVVLYNPCGVVIDTLEQQVSILHIPVANTSTSAVCAGTSLTLSASGFSNYSWSTGQNTGTVIVTPSVTTAYTVTATDVYGCNYRSVNVVTVNALPLISIAGDTFVCEGAVSTQTAGGAVSYTWSNGATTPVTGLAPAASAIYTVTGTDANGCTGIGTKSITVIQIPVFTAGSATACSDVSVTLTAMAGNTLQSAAYTWLPGNLSGTSVAVSATSTQEYTVTASVGACSFSSIATLSTATPDLVASASQTISPGSSVSLLASGGTSFTWDPPAYLSCSACSNPVASPPNDMAYCVTAFQNSCTATTCLTITVSCDIEGDLSLPNAFTPNGDGNNDEFCLRGWECTLDFNVRIFNRWGENVFESADPAFCWDGIYKGRLLEPAVFVYMVRAKKRDGEVLMKKGNITLIR